MAYNRQKVDQQVNRPAGKKVSAQRLQAVAAAKKIPRVRVEPTSDAYRQAIRHPNSGGFRPTGSVEWPNDRFTQRRVAEGAVKIVESAEGRQERHQEAHQQKEHRARQSRKPAHEQGHSSHEPEAEAK
jgi:hypothetical protein